jgi:hypothetical protein
LLGSVARLEEPRWPKTGFVSDLNRRTFGNRYRAAEEFQPAEQLSLKHVRIGLIEG